MCREIVILENKVLKLKNVLIRPIIFDHEKALDKNIHMMESYIKNQGLESIGPLILGTIVVGKENPKLTMNVIIQLKLTHDRPIKPYEFQSELKIGPCLYSSFAGKEEHFNIAQSKMQVYAYENGLILDTKSYCVFKEKDSDRVVIDTFVPIVGKEAFSHEGL